jgi:hypothetical protein
MFEAVRFFWNATRGYRLRPWQSPYLRWRFETYTGKRAQEVGPRDFLHLAHTERRQLLRFFGWLGEIRAYAVASLKR